jgi:hypothetical protein
MDQNGTNPLVALPHAEQFQARMSGTSQYALFEYCQASKALDSLYDVMLPNLEAATLGFVTRGKAWATNVTIKNSNEAAGNFMCMFCKRGNE